MIQPAGTALRARELGEAINGHPELVDEALPELAALLAVATDDQVILETVQALRYASDERAAQLVLPLARAGHPNAEIRQWLTAVLVHGGESERVRAQVISALVPMTADAVARVRDWACFGLGMLNADGEEVRAALVARLDDEDVDTRAEALDALSKAGDPRALAAVLARLTGSEALTVQDLKSAGELADPSLLPALNELATSWAGDLDEFTELLDKARRRCAIDAADLAGELEQQFRAGLDDGLRGAGFSVELEDRYPRTRVRFLMNSLRGPAYPHRLWDWPQAPADFNLEQQVASWRP